LQAVQQPDLHGGLRLLLDRRLLQGCRCDDQRGRHLPAHERPELRVLSDHDLKLSAVKTPGGASPPGFSFWRQIPLFEKETVSQSHCEGAKRLEQSRMSSKK